MMRFKLTILLIFIISRVSAQDYLHLCVGENKNFGVPFSNGSTYNWQIKGDNNIAIITSGNGTNDIKIDLNSFGVFQLFVEEVNIYGCIGYDSIFVKIHDLPTPVIFANGPTTFCDGSSVLLEVDSIYENMIWNNYLNTDSQQLNVDSTASYFVTVTDEYGCISNSNSIFVSSNNIIVPNFSYDGFCIKNPISFFNNSTTSDGDFISTLWSIDSTNFLFGDTIDFTFSEVGLHTISLNVSTNNNCQDSVTKVININQNPIADFIYSPMTVSNLNPLVNFFTTSINPNMVTWFINDSIFSFDINTNYSLDNPGINKVMLLVEDSNRCIDSITKNIITYYDFMLYIPTSFSPNNDGINDSFAPKGLRMDKYLAYEFEIFNRWGDKVFKTNDVNAKWNGDGVQDGIYNWVVNLVDELGKLRVESGEVTLFR